METIFTPIEWDRLVSNLLIIGVITEIVSLLMASERAPEWAQMYASAISQGALNVFMAATVFFFLFLR